MRHPIRLWFPVLVFCLLTVVSSRASGASSGASSGVSAKATAVTAGLEHTCALVGSGSVECWGYNGHGELGTGAGSIPFSSLPIDIAVEGLISGVQTVSAGLRHSCAVTVFGGAMCWGVNYGGALGDGTGEEHLGPVHVLGLGSGVTSVSAGYDRSCGLLGSGGVMCWGTTYGLGPVGVPGFNGGVLAISASGSVGCAITTARGVKCWDAHYGPVDIPGLSGVTALATGGPFCAVVETGGVKCWGGDYGSTPVDVPGLTRGVRAIDTNGGHGCALMTRGGVKCWGLNSYGQLGDGTTTDRATPLDVAGLRSGATAIATGFGHSCALLDGGGIKCWGANFSGQLGDGTTVQRLRPVSVFGFGPGPGCVVPKVVGKRLAKARIAVARARCRVGTVARVASARSKNVVVGQSPRAGKRLKAGSKVRLTVSRGR